MKGLVSIPGTTELARAYGQMQAGHPVSCGELALWSQWSRFDPRLAEQCVAHVCRHWRGLLPAELRECLLRQPWPPAMGVLLEQAREFGRITPAQDAPVFGAWISCVMVGVEPARGEQFFIGLRALGGEAMRKDAYLALEPYRRWGYLGCEVLLNKAVLALAGERTLIPARVRRAVLDELIECRPRITARDYREALEGWVSARQAELDLCAHPRLRPVGRARARIYRVK